MGTVIGDILPLALGVAISPMPIIAVILMLLSARAGPASTAFLVGWIAGIVIAATIITILAEVAGLSNSGNGSTAGAIIKLIVGALMLLLAVKQWRSRPSPDVEPPAPKWLSALDTMTPGKSGGLGFALAAANPKNLLMTLAAGVAIGQAELPVGQIVIVIAIFTVIAASTVIAPVLVYRLARSSAQEWLGSMKTWMVANNAMIMMILFLVIGTVLIGKGIGGL
ncbi:MAG TPA: GAP family protein [Micromonosporaceae bacterium]|jgi:threonine/homoserine/homoserine lactone efflux protein